MARYGIPRRFGVNDNEKESFMVALDKATGRQIWRIERQERSNWSTPYVWEHDGRTEIVTIGTGRIRSYDLDAKVLWELNGTSGLVSITPVASHGLLYVGAGYHYGPLYAVRPGASGDTPLPACGWLARGDTGASPASQPCSRPGPRSASDASAQRRPARRVAPTSFIDSFSFWPLLRGPTFTSTGLYALERCGQGAPRPSR